MANFYGDKKGDKRNGEKTDYEDIEKQIGIKQNRCG